MFIYLTSASADLNPRVYGTVVDSSGLPLTGAHVTIAESQTGAVTDWTGRYRMYDITSGSYTISVSHLGYDTSVEHNVTVYEDAPACINFTLIPIVISGPVAIVRARQLPVFLSYDQKVSISSEAWQSSGAGSVGEVLREIPGVSVLEGDGSQRLSLRGSPSRNVRVDLDGIPLNDAGTGEAEVAHIDLDQLASIQVEFDGIGGKVHLKTTDFTSSTGSARSLTASAMHSSYGKYDLGVGFTRQNRRFSGGAHYKQKSNKGDFNYQLDDGTTQYRVNNQSSSSSGIGKFVYGTVSREHECGAYYEEVRRGIPGLTYAIPTPEAILHNKRLSARIALKGKHGLAGYSLSGFVSDYTSRYICPKLQYNPATNSTVQLLPEDNKQSGFRYGLTTNSELVLKRGKLHLDYSYQVDRYKGEDLLRGRVIIGGVGFGDACRTTNRVESGGRWWGKKWGIRCHLSPSLAVEDIHDAGNQYYFSISPSFNIAFEKPTELCLLSLTSGWGRSLSAPPFNALFLIENTFAVGNKDLKPEQGESYYTGVTFSPARHVSRMLWRVGISSNWRQIKDLIIWKRNFQGKYYPANVDRVKGHGIEINGSIDPFEGTISLFSSYIYSKSVNDMPGDINYGNLIPLTAKHSGSASITIIRWNTALHLSSRWVGRRYSTEANMDPMSTAGRGLPPYTVYNLNISREFNIRRVLLTCRAGIYNLLDESYRVIERSPMPGRTYNIKLGLSI